MADAKISALTAATTPLAGTEVLPIVQSGTTKKVSIADVTAGRGISTTDVTVSSDTGNIELNWAAGSNHTIGSKFLTAYFTGMRIDADTRNTDIVSLDASGIGNVRIRTGTTETTRLNVDPTGDVTISTGNVIIGTSGKGIDFSADGSAAGMTSELLDDYEEGTWTPTDASGAGLTLTVSAGTCFYTKVGRMVTCSFAIAYPATADVSSAVIGGLPFVSGGSSAVFGGYVTYTDASLNLTFLATASAQIFNLYTTAGVDVKNNEMSGKALRGTLVYFV